MRMSIAKRGLALASGLARQSLYNSKTYMFARPLRIEKSADPHGDAHDLVEAFTALFYRCRKAKQVIDAHDQRRLATYCGSLGLRLSRSAFVSPHQISCSPDYSATLQRLEPNILDAVRSDPAHEYLVAFLQFIDFAYGGKKLLAEERGFSVIPAGSAHVRSAGRSYTFSVFDCAVVIAECDGRFVLAHMKIGHAYTPRAHASLDALMNRVRDLPAGEPVSVYVIADNAFAVVRMISKAFRVAGIHGAVSLHLKSLVHCASVAVCLKDGKLDIRMSSQIAAQLDWPGWSEITGIMPPSPISVEVVFENAGPI